MTAACNTPHCTVLHSDGLSVNGKGLNIDNTFKLSEHTDRIKDRSLRKVFKLNEQVGLLWSGDFIHYGESFRFYCTEEEIKTPEVITEALSELMAEDIPEESVNDPHASFTAQVIGYHKGELYGSTINMDFEPEIHKLRPNFVGCSVACRDKEEATTRLNKMVVGSFANHNFRRACIGGFTKTVNMYKKEDAPVGGKLFHEEIQPKESLFQQAIRRN